MRYCNEKGRSMLEMLCVLGIMGILSVAALNGYQYMMAKYKANKEVDLVSQMIAVIHQAYIQQENYEGLSNTTLDSLKVLPTDFQSQTSQGSLVLQSPYGGFFSTYSSHPESGSSTTKDHDTTAVLEVYRISKDTCLFLATTNWGIGLKEGVIAVSAASESTCIPSTINNDSKNKAMICNAGKLANSAYANFDSTTTPASTFGSENSGTAMAVANPPSKLKDKGYNLPMRPSLAAQGCNCVDEETGLDTEECSFAIKFY